MSALSDLFDGAGEAGKQLFVWGILFSVINSLTQPYQRDLTYLVNDIDPNVLPSPTELADFVVRGIMAEADAAPVAKKSGINATVFKDKVHNAGEPPALQQVLEWWRRGFIDFGEAGPTKTTVANAIATSRVYTYWTDIIKKGQFVPPSVADAVNAVLRNQISHDEGIALAYFNGLGTHELTAPSGADTSQTETAFKLLLDTVGNPPSLSELLELVRRGLIQLGDTTPATATPDPTATTFAQGIFEGDNKDKWLPLYAKLVTYVPPARTVTAVYKAGGYTYTQALQKFKDYGLTQTDAVAYLKSASGTKLAGSKQLAQSIIQKLYFDKAVSRTEASTMLVHLGYDATEAAFILDIQDMQRTQKALTSAINRIGTLYIDHKLQQTTASTALARLGVAPEQVSTLISTWDLERAANVKPLTPAEIAGLVKYTVIPVTLALTKLQQLGYQPWTAWAYMSYELKSKLPNEPAQTAVNPIGVLPAG